MAQKEPANLLRSYRKKSGLTQGELAHLLGYENKSPVSRHETGISAPTLGIALAYQAIFRVPVAKLFPGLYKTVEQMTEARLTELEVELKEKSAKGRNTHAIAQALEWIWARKNRVEF